MSDEKIKGKLGALLILDVDAYVLEGVKGTYNSVDMAGEGVGPGECHQQRLALVKEGVAVSCQISHKEPFILTAAKKWETVVINGSMITVKDKAAFSKALKSKATTVLVQASSLEGFQKNGEQKIGKKNFNIFK